MTLSELPAICRRWVSRSIRSGTAKKRLTGGVLLVIILALFFSLNRFPKIDTIEGDVDAVSGSVIECFQGFCIERDRSASFFDSWFDFSVTYIRAVLIGMTFAFLAAGLVESFFFPRGSPVGVFGGSRLRRTLSGIAIGPVLNLCAACIVPVSASIHRRGGGIEGAIAAVQASSTLNFLAIGMVFFVFTPILGISRLLMALISALLLGHVVAVAVRLRERDSAEPEEQNAVGAVQIEPADDVVSWPVAMKEGFRDWARITLLYQVRLWPIMIAAGFISGLAIQWLSPETASQYLGNDVQGVLVAATFGLLINVPLLFEIPLVALLVILGIGIAPAATLLFSVAAGGPVTFWGLARYLPKRAIVAFGGATWALGVSGGFAVLAISSFVWPQIGDGVVKLVKSPTAAEEVRRLGRAAPRFEEVANEAGVQFNHVRDDDFFNLGGGAAAADFDGDGWLDIYVTNSKGPNALYRNNGDGTFTDVANRLGVADWLGHGYGAAWGDYDNDGMPDLYVANYGTSRLFRNTGTGGFTDVTASAGVGDPGLDYRTTGVAWGDYDADGWLDLVVVRHINTDGPQFTLRSTAHAVLLDSCRTPEFLANPKVPRGVVIGDPHDFENTAKRDFSEATRSLKLYRNTGQGRFEDVTSLLDDTRGYPSNVMGAGFKPSFLDFDGDGDSDIYVVNDFGDENYPNVLWRNDGRSASGDWTFTDVSAESGADLVLYGMGLAAGDYDNDGDLDLSMTDIGPSRFLENRDGRFVEVTNRTATGRGLIPENGEVTQSVGWGTTFADFDNDGFLDLYTVGGYIDSDPCSNHPYQPNAVFINKGNGAFTNVSKSSGANDPGTGREVVVGDFNNDGLIDLYVVNIGNLESDAGLARLYLNTYKLPNSWLEVKPLTSEGGSLSVGARVRVTVGSVTRVQYVGLSQGHMSQSLTAAHFGLGKASRADLVEVRWPDGSIQRFTDVALNQTLTAIQPGPGVTSPR